MECDQTPGSWWRPTRPGGTLPLPPGPYGRTVRRCGPENNLGPFPLWGARPATAVPRLRLEPGRCPAAGVRRLAGREPVRGRLQRIAGGARTRDDPHPAQPAHLASGVRPPAPHARVLVQAARGRHAPDQQQARIWRPPGALPALRLENHHALERKERRLRHPGTASNRRPFATAGCSVSGVSLNGEPGRSSVPTLTTGPALAPDLPT